MPDPHRARPATSRLVRTAWAVLGVVFVILGAFGLLLPGLPTTPFLLLAAACFFRTSQKLYDRVARNPTFGPAIRAFRETGGISRRVKTLALSTMTVFVTLGVWLGVPPDRPGLRVAIVALALVGAGYILWLPTVPETPPGKDDSGGEAGGSDG